VAGEVVLVTGGSGFVGAHCVLQLLAAGYRVRTTVRSLSREADVREMINRGGGDPEAAIDFFAADLTNDAGWAEAVAGADYVLHVASPFPSSQPKNEDDVIIPAREGALRVLKAARDAGVKRVVLTSSFAAIGYSDAHPGRPFTEEDWTDPTASNITPYVKSKTLAERAAWDFMKTDGGKLELAVVNPVGILGPALSKDVSTSVELAIALMDGAMPGIPNLSFGLVDVRDVADLHLRAMTNPAAKGERFLAIAGAAMSFPQMADVLRERMGDAASRVPKRVLPNGLVRALALVTPRLREIVPNLGRVKEASNAKAKRVLGWNPRSNEDALVATAQSLIDLDLLKH
jgi:dihydroflavonol-4-reductase